jgi:hypothetical protein
MEETWNGKKTHSPEIKAGRKEYKLQPRNSSKIRNKDRLKGTNWCNREIKVREVKNVS